MTETEAETDSRQKRTLGQWLFNPFQFIAGPKALFVGLIIILLTAFIGSLSQAHFSGVLDMQIDLLNQQPVAHWVYFAEVLVDWLCMSAILMIAGFFVSRSSVRVIDVFGTQALARAPYLLGALVVLPAGLKRFTEYLLWQQTRQGTEVTIQSTDILFVILAGIVIIPVVIWMVALMYKAYTVSCNIKGKKAIITFIISLVLAEIVSKVLILALLSNTLGANSNDF